MALWVRLNWRVAATPIPDAARTHLADYLARYAQTYRVAIREAGVGSEGVELVLLLPFDRSLDEIVAPLRDASARFLKGGLGVAGFSWHPAWSAVSLAPPDEAESDPEDDLPGWLREALGEPPAPEENG